jgi:23S rRNA (cytidine1920-2'-O)/16S rRNA (cytidine1409-2'-O)-methyltransferase
LKEKVEKQRKMRIDLLMVQKGLVESRETAQRLILAGKVLIGEKPVMKASQTAGPEDPVTVLEGLKYASRGGLKLEKALEEFRIDVTNTVVVDVGASTGGFTDALLQRGAAKVYAVDVGYGQLAWKLRQDPRVVLMERANARNIAPAMFSGPVDLAVMDVSFISAHLILEPLAAITREAVVLVKPQFEAGPRDVPRGGVIRDPEVHRRVLSGFCRQLHAWHVHGMIDSPIRGGEGNREFLLYLKQASGWPSERIESRIKELIA